MKTACYANGMNVVNINYRMGDGICYKQMMQDMTDAVRYVLAHAEEWNIKKTNYVMWGGSAGAHLSLLYAYNYDKEDVISLVITLGAPTRLDALDALSVQSKAILKDCYQSLPVNRGTVTLLSWMSIISWQVLITEKTLSLLS